MKKKWLISRQCYYYTGEQVVEVSFGPDGAGPDMLCESYKHLGEGKWYDVPTDIPHHARAIRDAWIWDLFWREGNVYPKPHKRNRLAPLPEQILPVTIQVNSPGIHGFVGEPISFEDLDKWAQAQWEALPKCDECGDPIDEHEWYYRFDDPFQGRDGGRFCSEHCSTKNWGKDIHECDRESCGKEVTNAKTIWINDGEKGYCSYDCQEMDEESEDEDSLSSTDDAARQAWSDYTSEVADRINRENRRNDMPDW